MGQDFFINKKSTLPVLKMELVNDGRNDFRNFQSLFNSSPEVKNFIQNPTQSKNTQNNVINLLSEKLGFSKNLKNFFLLLIMQCY